VLEVLSKRIPAMSVQSLDGPTIRRPAGRTHLVGAAPIRPLLETPLTGVGVKQVRRGALRGQIEAATTDCISKRSKTGWWWWQRRRTPKGRKIERPPRACFQGRTMVRWTSLSANNMKRHCSRRVVFLSLCCRKHTEIRTILGSMASSSMTKTIA
jgi:hypothetical protein